MEEEKYRLNQDLNAKVINKANVTYLRKTVFMLFIIFTVLSILLLDFGTFWLLFLGENTYPSLKLLSGL